MSGLGWTVPALVALAVLTGSGGWEVAKHWRRGWIEATATLVVMVLFCPYATYKFVHRASAGDGHDDRHRTGVAGMAVAAGGRG